MTALSTIVRMVLGTVQLLVVFVTLTLLLFSTSSSLSFSSNSTCLIIRTLYFGPKKLKKEFFFKNYIPKE